jgi:uncharacterized oxidoreductase
MKLEGHTILVTGGGGGIGFGFAKQLRALGNTVIVTGRDAAKLARAKKEIEGLHTIQNDQSRPDQIEALFTEVTTKFPALDVVINNAGISKAVNLHDAAASLASLTDEIDVNFRGPVQLISKFLPHLKTKDGAAIVNVTSGLAFVPLPILPIYCATKAAFHSFTLSLRVQLKSTKVKVFEVAPQTTQTDLIAGFSEEDMKGQSVMSVDDAVKTALAGIAADRLEIRLGQANQLRWMNRIAPEFILGQLSKPVDRMLREGVRQ